MNISRRSFVAAGLVVASSLIASTNPVFALGQSRANASIHCLIDTTIDNAQYAGIYLPTREINYSRINLSLFTKPRTAGALSIPASFSETGFSGRSVIGHDSRTRLTGTDSPPYNATCFIQTEWPDGAIGYGTASFSSLTMALTAGHCVFSIKHGGFAKSIRVWPGRNGDFIPYGSVDVDSVYLPIEYYQTRDKRFDYAALGFIPSSFPSTLNKRSYLGAHAYYDNNAGGQYIRIDGYPYESFAEFWGSMGYIESDPANSSYMWRYSIDTSEGMSGTPLATLAGAPNPSQIVGIHTSGTNDSSTNPYNYAVKMDSRMLCFATSFRVNGEDWGNA